MNRIERIASSPTLLNGVAVSPGGRLFASFPRWTPGPTPSVAEWRDGAFHPFPGGAWNAWAPGQPTKGGIVSAHSVHADRYNQLWIIDDASPRSSPPVPGAAKLLRIDLATDRLAATYAFDAGFLPAGTMLGHLRTDGRHAYVSEAHHGSIVVVDLADGSHWHRLEGHASIQADTSIVPVIEGREFRRADGKPPVLHVDIIELSEDGQWLYFMPLFGPMLRRVPTALLADRAAGDQDVAAAVEDVIAVPPCAGMAQDGRSGFLLCAFTQDAILRLADGRLETVASDPRISFPNEGAMAPDGAFCFPGSQIHRLPAFNGGVSRVQPPFEVLRLALD